MRTTNAAEDLPRLDGVATIQRILACMEAGKKEVL